MGTVDDPGSGQMILPYCSVTYKHVEPVSLGVSTNHEERGKLTFFLSACQNSSSGKA